MEQKMSKAANNAAAFLANMNKDMSHEPEVSPAPEAPKAQVTPVEKAPKPKAIAKSRENLKHIGGYVDDATVEKVAVLRARLKMDNSELITEAISDLYNKHKTKKAFTV
jgi:hypothetical protein